MIYSITRAISAALALGLTAQLPGVAVAALVLLWSMSALLLAPLSVSLEVMPLFFEVTFGLWLGLAASLPIVAARMGFALSDTRMASSWETLGALCAGVLLFAAGVDHLLLRAFAESLIEIPAGTAQQVLKRPEDLVSFILLTLRFGLKIGFAGLAGLLSADLFNSMIARLFPGVLSLQLPRDSIKVLGLYTSLGAIGYVILQAAQTALSLIGSK
jgi:flagellar biosynthesis protein FliR